MKREQHTRIGLVAAIAVASSACAASGTWMNDGLAPDDRAALVASAGVRMATGRWRSIGVDAGVRAYRVENDSTGIAGHVNVLLDLYEPLYAFSGLGYGRDAADRTWELGFGAQLDVALTPTGPLAVFAEIGYGEAYPETPRTAELPLSLPVYGSFLRLGVTWCPSMRFDC